MVLSKDIKFAIIFGLIVGVIISFCSLCFGAETEVVDVVNIPNITMNTSNYTFISVSNSLSTNYFVIEPGYLYTITNNRSDSIVMGYSEDVPSVGNSYKFIGILQGSNSYSFNSNLYEYFYFDYAPTSNVTVTRQELTGFNGFINSLVYSLSLNELSNVFNYIVPILVIGVLFGLGFYFIIRISNKIKRSKGGV